MACPGYRTPRLKNRNGLPVATPNPEKELLSAARENGGSINPAEATMKETSLTVREADEMLTELANEGHLRVSSRDGVISYGLPALESQGG